MHVMNENELIQKWGDSTKISQSQSDLHHMESFAGLPPGGFQEAKMRGRFRCRGSEAHMTGSNLACGHSVRQVGPSRCVLSFGL